MSTQVKVPTFPESISEGTIAAWRKNEGDAVKAGDVLVEIETDKVVLEVQASVNGVLGKLLKKAGDTVKSEEVIGAIAEGAAASAPAAAPTPKAEAPAAKAPAAKVEAPAVKTESKKTDAPIDASPSVRRKLAETGGQLTIKAVSGARTEQRVPMTRLRKTIANRLLEVKQNTAMLTTFNEVDMKPVMDLRAKYKDQFEKKFGVKLGFMSFFTKAAVEALKQFPSVNASIDGDDIVYHGYYDVGIAVSSPRGLVVPIVRNTESLSLADIEAQIRDLAIKARDSKLTLEEMQGGTFTITNGGIFGSMLSTPILNAPQSAILGMHNIVERPVAINGQVVIRPIMYLALSYDHRIIDGRESVSFLKTMKEYLEDPARLLLNV